MTLSENLCEPLNSVSFLSIEYNPFTGAGLTEFLKPLAKSRLQSLGVHLALNPQQEKIITRINQSRKAQGSTHALVVRPIGVQDTQSPVINEAATATMRMVSEPELSRRPHHHFK